MSYDLKVGDYITTNREFGSGVVLHKILRETETMWITDGRRFRKDLSVVAPGRWGPFNGRPATHADHIQHRIQIAQDRLRALVVTESCLAEAEALIAAVRKESAK